MQKIRFNPTSPLAEQTVPIPAPARSYFPDWYKSAPALPEGKMGRDESGDVPRGLKMCMPFMDAMSAGYIQESWQDIAIDVKRMEDGAYGVQFNFPTEPRIMNYRPTSSVAVGDEFYPVEFTFHPAWVPEVPKGWSVLYQTPFNRLDLPFQFLGGIVDNDTFTQSADASNMPFYIKKSFTGILPKGTPLVQMIPIKRDHWESEKSHYSEAEQNRIIAATKQYFWGGYRKTYWSKKTYN